MTSVNDLSKCIPDSSSNAKKRDKKINVYDETSEIHNEELRSNKNMELCTIIENKTGSDAEKSDETIFDEDSSAGNNKKNLQSKITSERSPILTIVDSECIHFVKSSQENDNDDDLNIYGNQAFEEHWTDVALIDTNAKRPRIRHSYSLDLTGAPKVNKKRKLSVETKLETVIRTKELLDNIIDL